MFLFYTNSSDKTLIIKGIIASALRLAEPRALKERPLRGKGAEPERDSRGGAREGGREAVTSAIQEQRGMVTSGHRMPGRAPVHGAGKGRVRLIACRTSEEAQLSTHLPRQPELGPRGGN